jgi:hypothetical protein
MMNGLFGLSRLSGLFGLSRKNRFDLVDAVYPDHRPFRQEAKSTNPIELNKPDKPNKPDKLMALPASPNSTAG